MKNSFRDLKVWQEAFRLATAIGEVVRRFTSSDRIDFGSQLIRSAVSVPSNIAEGAGRTTAQDQKRFYVYAKGSLNELETQLEICTALGLITASDESRTQTLVASTRKALSGLLKSVERRIQNNSRFGN